MINIALKPSVKLFWAKETNCIVSLNKQGPAAKPGEGKPKCLSKAKAASLRSSGGKKAIANAVKRKRKADPNKDRKGKAKNVSNKPKK